MVMADVEVRRNGTGVPMAIKTVEIKLDDIGYAGWSVTMRTNPRSSVYDEFLAFDEPDRWWLAFGKIVQSWNFADEDGKSFPQPREVASEKELDLPPGVLVYVIQRYFDEFNAVTAVPKAQPVNSEPTSSTSDESLKSE